MTTLRNHYVHTYNVLTLFFHDLSQSDVVLEDRKLKAGALRLESSSSIKAHIASMASRVFGCR